MLEQEEQKQKLSQLMEFVMSSQIKESTIVSARTTEKANYLAQKEGDNNNNNNGEDPLQLIKEISEDELLQMECVKQKQRNQERLKEYLLREKEKKQTKVLSKQA